MFASVKDLMTAIANKIRGYINTGDKIPSKSIPQKIDEVYEAGRQAAYDAFWDVYQKNGTRESYSCAFGGDGWTSNTFKPKYNINVFDGYMMFRESGISGDLVELCEAQGITMNFSKAISVLYLLNAARHITRIGVLDLTSVANSSNANDMCARASGLITIDKIVLPSTRLNLSRAFDGCTSLANITIEGTIQYNFNVQSCPLTHDSLMSIINALGDGLSYTLTIGATNIAKLTQDEIQIAYNKGWNVA